MCTSCGAHFALCCDQCAELCDSEPSWEQCQSPVRSKVSDSGDSTHGWNEAQVCSQCGKKARQVSVLHARDRKRGQATYLYRCQPAGASKGPRVGTKWVVQTGFCTARGRDCADRTGGAARHISSSHSQVRRRKKKRCEVASWLDSNFGKASRDVLKNIHRASRLLQTLRQQQDFVDQRLVPFADGVRQRYSDAETN